MAFWEEHHISMSDNQAVQKPGSYGEAEETLGHHRMTKPGDGHFMRLIRLASGALNPEPGAGRIILALCFGLVTHIVFALAVVAMVVAMFSA